ncbi:hypothetical protein PHISP_05273 [Aspergillus sp. HF37]|nr:hypothetical protein PHISP_05273 [Aspergillus sp. HF37]
MDLWQESALLKGDGGLVLLIGSRRYYQLTSLLSEDYDPALNRYMGIFEGLRIQDLRDDSEDTDVAFDVIVKIRLQMDPPDELRHTAHQDDTPGETRHTHERSDDSHNPWENSCALVAHPAAKGLFDMHLHLGQTLCKMILFVPFVLDMVSSYLSVLREYLRHTAMAGRDMMWLRIPSRQR